MGMLSTAWPFIMWQFKTFEAACREACHVGGQHLGVAAQGVELQAMLQDHAAEVFVCGQPNAVAVALQLKAHGQEWLQAMSLN
jgi:hypothetical protein